MKTRSTVVVPKREQEGHYGLTLLQMLKPFMFLGAAFLVAVIVTVH